MFKSWALVLLNSSVSPLLLLQKYQWKIIKSFLKDYTGILFTCIGLNVSNLISSKCLNFSIFSYMFIKIVYKCKMLIIQTLFPKWFFFPILVIVCFNLQLPWPTLWKCISVFCILKFTEEIWELSSSGLQFIKYPYLMISLKV